jgi:hypothetical protein
MAHRKKKKQGIASDTAAFLVSKLARLKTPIPSRQEILGTCYVSDNISKQMLEGLRKEHLEVIDAARRDGWKPVRVYWESGQSAILLCPPGSDMPEPQLVVQAYEAHPSSGMGNPALAEGRS